MRQANKLIEEGRVPKRRALNSQILNDIVNGYYNDGIEAGYKIGFDDGCMKYDKRYEDGLNDAWEAARKLVHPNRGGLSTDAKIEMCGKPDSDYLLLEFSALEVIEKLRAYEEKQKQDVPDTNVGEIRVGDEVFANDHKAVVTAVFNNGRNIFTVNMNGQYGNFESEDVKKTGRHFPEIGKVLEQMRAKE